MIQATEFLDWMEEYFKGWVRPPTKSERFQAKQEYKRQKQTPMSTIKKANVKKVNSINPWNGNHGIIYYCQCEMDNGDKIEIGKKKEVQVGWELIYSITDTQQEWMKAKPHKPEELQQSSPSAPVSPTQNQNRSVDVNDSILYQVSLKGAMDYLTASHNPQYADTFTAQNVNDLALSIAQIAKSNIQKL